MYKFVPVPKHNRVGLWEERRQGFRNS